MYRLSTMVMLTALLSMAPGLHAATLENMGGIAKVPVSTTQSYNTGSAQDNLHAASSLGSSLDERRGTHASDEAGSSHRHSVAEPSSVALLGLGLLMLAALRRRISRDDS